MDEADYSKRARNSILVLVLIGAVIVAGNLLVDRSEDPAGAEIAQPQAGLVSSESSTLILFNLAFLLGTY